MFSSRENSSSILAQAWPEGAPAKVPDTTRISAQQAAQGFRGFSVAYNFLDRDLYEHELALHFKVADLPEKSTMLVIGGGALRTFEKELQAMRPDVTAVSVDPLLQFGVQERLREAIRFGGLNRYDGQGPYIDVPMGLGDAEEYYRPNAVCGGFAPAAPDVRNNTNYLPIASGSIDTVVALYSLPLYLQPTQTPALLQETMRVMKPGANAYFYPFYDDQLPELGQPEYDRVACSEFRPDPHEPDVGSLHFRTTI